MYIFSEPGQVLRGTVVCVPCAINVHNKHLHSFKKNKSSATKVHVEEECIKL